VGNPFRLGGWAWGVQFHPEYSMDILRSYIREQKDELEDAGRNVAELLGAVSETPFAARTLQNFGRIVQERLAGNTS